jgi:hypothetical protein
LKEALYFTIFIKQFAKFYILNKDIDNFLSDLGGLKLLSDENINDIINKYHTKALGTIGPTNLKLFDEIINRIFNFEINVNDFEDFYDKLSKQL